MADLNPMQWTWPQLQAAGKHVASYAAGGVSVFVALHFISPPQGLEATESINSIVDGVTQIAKGVAGLAAILVPVYTSWRAAHNASPAQQVEHVVAQLNASPGTQAANALADPTSRQKIIEAVAEMPEVKKVVPVDPALASAIPSPKVTPV